MTSNFWNILNITKYARLKQTSTTLLYLGYSQAIHPQFFTTTKPSPNLNILCVQYLDAFPLSKNHKKFNWSEKLKKHIWAQVTSCSFAFWNSKVPFLKIWSPFHFFIWYYNLLFLFVILGNVPFLTHKVIYAFGFDLRLWLSCLSSLHYKHLILMAL